MSRRTGELLAGAALVAALATPAPADLSVVATVDRNPAVEGVALTLRVTISGTLTGAGEPVLPPELRERFDVFSSGTSRQMTFANGVTESSITHSYQIVPRSSGTLVIPPIALDVGSERVRTAPIQLEVTPSGAPPRARRPAPGGAAAESAVPEGAELELIASVDDSRVVEGEEIVLTISFIHRVRLIDRPEFDPPSTTGFVTQRLPDGPMRDEVRGGVAYTVQELRYALFPLGRGEKTIGPATVRATVPRRGRRDAFSVFGSWFDGREVVVTSEPLTIRVDPLPPTDDPAFSGAVGTFSMRASIDTDEVAVNDPVTLTIRVSGVGNLGSAGEIASPETARFRVFDAASDLEQRVVGDRLGGVRTIQRAFVPLAEGDQVIPEVRFTYYDPAADMYRTHRAGPFPIHVRPGTMATGAPLVVGKHEVQRLDDDIRFIRTSMGELREIGERTSAVPAVVHVVPLALVGGALLWRRRQDRLASDASYARDRRAASRARARLGEARRAPERAASMAWSAIGGYLADRFDTAESTLTVTEAHRRVEPLDRDLAAAIERLGARCDFARFAPSDAAGKAAEIVVEAEAVLKRLESASLGPGPRIAVLSGRGRSR